MEGWIRSREVVYAVVAAIDVLCVVMLLPIWFTANFAVVVCRVAEVLLTTD